jgi:hypothetical protein
MRRIESLANDGQYARVGEFVEDCPGPAYTPSMLYLLPPSAAPTLAAWQANRPDEG